MEMSKTSPQSKFWQGESGRAYTDRNPESVQELEALYLKDYGISRSAMNEEFLSGFERSIKILEVGANVGVQLEMLRQQGFENLLGIEINKYAVLQAKKLRPEIDIIVGSAFDLPFRDRYFDLVFTSGVLIHIAPHDLGQALNEIYRVSNCYIWGFEYFADELTEVKYRGQSGLLWKADFSKVYREKFPELKLVKEKKFVLQGTDNLSQMFLLEKRRKVKAYG